MKQIVKKLLWQAYFIYDYLKCFSSFSKTRNIDLDLSKNIVEFLKNFDKKRTVVIFACYEKSKNSLYINYVRSNLNNSIIIFINNTEKFTYGVDKITDNCLWVNRPNYLRDIGAYRLGINSLTKLSLSDEYGIVLTNDSIYILREEFFKLFSENYDAKVVGHSFSEKPAPHIRTYWIKISSELLIKTNEYLQKISPTRSRFSAINFGELGLSQNIFKNAGINTLPINKKIYAINIDGYDANIFQEIKSDAVTESVKNIIYFKLHYKNESLDPYQMLNSTEFFIPQLMKREVYEKNLAEKSSCLYWIKMSDLPLQVQEEIGKEIFINQRKPGISTKIKKLIGEI